jgi:hypothetical protein
MSRPVDDGRAALLRARAKLAAYRRELDARLERELDAEPVPARCGDCTRTTMACDCDDGSEVA